MNELDLILFRLSLGDLAAARCLYTNGHYRQSLFMFQQASEKANKGWVLLAGEVKEQDLKKFSHSQVGIYESITKKKKKEVEEIIHALSAYPHALNSTLPVMDFNTYYKMMEQALLDLTVLKKTNTDILSLSNLNLLIRGLKEVQNVKITRPRNMKAELKKYFKQVAEWSGKFNTSSALATERELLELINDKKKLVELSDHTFDHLELQLQLIFSQLTLFVCAMVTNHHSTTTRYPEGDIDPDIMYTMKLPLVKKQEVFMDLLENAITRIILITGNKNI